MLLAGKYDAEALLTHCDSSGDIYIYIYTVCVLCRRNAVKWTICAEVL